MSKTPERKSFIQVPDSSPAVQASSPLPPSRLTLREKFTYSDTSNSTDEQSKDGNGISAGSNLSSTTSNHSLNDKKNVLLLKKKYPNLNINQIIEFYKRNNSNLKETSTFLNQYVHDNHLEVKKAEQQKTTKVVLNKPSQTIASRYLLKKDTLPTSQLLSAPKKIDINVEDNKKRRRSKKSKPQNDQQVISLSDEEEEAILDDDNDDDDDESLVDDDDIMHVSSQVVLDDRVLKFLNTADKRDIIDISSVSPSIAEVLISKRPFHSLHQVESNDFAVDNTENDTLMNKNDGTGKKSRKKLIGAKIVEKTSINLKGYDAVDSLIQKCSEYGNLIASTIREWGIGVDGKAGELEVVDIDDDPIRLSKNSYFKDKPKLLSPDVNLKNYQQVGINWLNLLYKNNLSCILADEMGLGKTCQVIAFLAHLKEKAKNSDKPHLIVVPSSTLENWLREFEKFCPSLTVVPYYGNQQERTDQRYELLQEDVEFDVLITTYNLATGNKYDQNFLRSFKFNCIVYDEGHMLKNSASERYIKLMKLKGVFRLLLTGTPLQNNLKELISLLAFIMPDLFKEKKDDLKTLFDQQRITDSKNNKNNGDNGNKDEYNPLLSQQAISKAKTMMTPFVLRRKKNQVLQHLPKKIQFVEKCEMLDEHKSIYEELIESAKQNKLNSEAKNDKSSGSTSSSSNVIMQLRKAAIHPLLFRRIYDDSKLQKMATSIMEEPEYVDANRQYIFEDMQVMSDFELNRLCLKFPKSLSKFQLKDKDFFKSGKILKLKELLEDIVNNRHEKVLVFSLFTQILDILEKFLSILNIKFIRLDGSTSVNERQQIIDQFYQDDMIPVFLLSTKAGGFGINLVCANNVIIFDQSFNPHDDRQAEDRCHRVGQTKEVNVYRLISTNSIEEKMLQMGENKLELDKSVSNEEEFLLKELI
ncbi:hypothetical protein PACTADRAFT_83641 [Pachysolen tannophilus NRRL Y-2460]|uniref:DNA helicase n=1 Tax=Pachysolen tannophilus NRRL Y-2460 TaxID=669874 RepID=A0A1E4U2W8_PACTA|nr:hypothetical protein PACTADRAFT_83641 [Pachysolen tannophilus NRRL Y-2460]